MPGPHRPTTTPAEGPAIAGYAAARARVEAAERRMRLLVARSHTPVAARDAARELTLALGDATASAVRAQQSAPGALRGELVRLGAISAWLRRTTMDDLGVNIPTTVRPTTRAAYGPHVPGIDFEPPNAPPQPAVGIDLAAVVDADTMGGTA